LNLHNDSRQPPLLEITMANKILITGASGTIGSALVKQLQSTGADLEVMTSKPETKVHGLATRRASFDDVAQLTQAFKGIDTLFVLLPLVPNKVQLARNVAAAAQAAGVKHIVRSSGAGADVNATFSLPKLQGTIDQIMTDTGIPSTFLRNAGFMQNYVTFYQGLVKSGMVYAASADAAQSLVDVRDIAAVAALILRAPAAHAGKAYTLTGGEALTDTQRAAILSLAVGHTVGFTAISVEQAAHTMKSDWGMPEVMVDWMSSYNQIVSAGDAAGISSDVQKLLGRAPIAFKQFAQDHAALWR
jgi:uncharacterized protein YbjT (DUF2867 family)